MNVDAAEGGDSLGRGGEADQEGFPICSLLVSGPGGPVPTSTMDLRPGGMTSV